MIRNVVCLAAVLLAAASMGGAAARQESEPLSIFVGTAGALSGSSGILVLNGDVAHERLFRWKSSDSVLGDIDTGFLPGLTWNHIAGSPNRLVFTANQRGVAITGNVIFETYSRTVVDVVKGSARVRYLLRGVPVHMILADPADNEIAYAAQADEATQSRFEPPPGQPGGNGGFGGPPFDTMLTTLADPFRLESVVLNTRAVPRTVSYTLTSNVAAFTQPFLLTETSPGLFVDATRSQHMLVAGQPANDPTVFDTFDVVYMTSTFGWFGARTLGETGVDTGVFVSEHPRLTVSMNTAPSDTVVDTLFVTLDSELPAKDGIGVVTDTLTETGPATNQFSGTAVTASAVFYPPAAGGRWAMTATVDNTRLGFTHVKIDAVEDAALPSLTLTTAALHNRGTPTYDGIATLGFWTPLIPSPGAPVASLFDKPQKAILVYRRGAADWAVVNNLEFLRLYNSGGHIRMSIAEEPTRRYVFYVISDPNFTTPSWHKVPKPAQPGFLPHPDWWYDGLDTYKQDVMLTGIAAGDALRVVWDQDGDGRYDQKAETVFAELVIVAVDLAISDSQGGQFPPEIAEADEWNRGAFTVANLNDTDGDAIIDRNDDMIDGGERDLMRIVLHRPTPDLGGTVELKVRPASAVVWLRFDKDARPPSLVFPSNQDTVLWVEATAASAAVRDIVLELEYRFPRGLARDTVRATAVWATVLGLRNGAGQAPSPDADGANVQAWIAAHGGSLGMQVVPVTGQQPVQFFNNVELGFTVAPPGIGNEAAVAFDISRRRTTEGVTIRTFAGQRVDRTVAPADPFPAGDELPNDDGLGGDDEDVVPTNDHVYSFDGPGPEADNWDQRLGAQIVRNANFEEFVRVRFDGTRPAGNRVDGSRSSEKLLWFSRSDIRKAEGATTFGVSSSSSGQGNPAFPALPQ
jgi:hypothetical protein